MLSHTSQCSPLVSSWTTGLQHAPGVLAATAPAAISRAGRHSQEKAKIRREGVALEKAISGMRSSRLSAIRQTVRFAAAWQTTPKRPVYEDGMPNTDSNDAVVMYEEAVGYFNTFRKQRVSANLSVVACAFDAGATRGSFSVESTNGLLNPTLV